MIIDDLGRRFEKLRISLTSECNFACLYCVGENNHENHHACSTNAKHLKVEDYIRIVKQINAASPLKSIKLTGGEPLLYPYVTDLITGLRNLGIEDISMTTNGFFLKQHAVNLKGAGIKNINISLDTMEESVFNKLSKKGNLQRVIEGILFAKEAGILVKLNSVIMKGVNENQIIPLLNFATQNNMKIRYLELMKMGSFNKDNKHFFSEAQILKTIETKYRFTKLPRSYSATANYWKLENGGVFGIIANESTPFCHDCNRLRLDSYGNIYGCLSNLFGYNIANENNIEHKLNLAMQQKQKVKFQGSNITMKTIGG